MTVLPMPTETCVMVNGRHVFQPRFRSEAEASAYREGAEAILDRAI